MAKSLADILSEELDTGDPHAGRQKWYIRKVDKKHYGRFHWNSGKQSFVRRGGRYNDKREAEQAAQLSI